MNSRLSPQHYVAHTHELLAINGLAPTWRVLIVPNMGRRLGTCSYSRQTIRLNQLHVMTAAHEAILDTIRHEVAHALAHARHGDAIKPHGPQWKAAARELGAIPRASVPLTEQEKALRDGAKALNNLLKSGQARHRPAPKRTRKRPTTTFASRELGRTIRAGDVFTFQGKTYEVVETKRTRFTGRAKHDGRLYSIPASAINRGTFS